MAVWSLPRVTFRELGSIEETRPVALLTHTDVWAVLSGSLSLPIVIQAEPARFDRDLFTYLADNLPSTVEAVYVVGDGAPVQAGKVVASANDIPLVIVPTALDTDMMLTPFALMEDRSSGEPRLVTLETGPADEIIIDWGVIEGAPDHLRAGGIVDVLSIVTGLLDWRLAARKGRNPSGQRFEPWAAGVAASLAQQAIKSAGAIGKGQPDALETLLDLMMMAVQLSNQLGHTRVREGSEHDLARMLAGQTGGRLTHSELVGISLLFVAALHGQDPTSLREALQGAGVRLDVLRPTDMMITLNHLAAYLESYKFPYSILHEIEPGTERVIQAMSAAGIALPDGTWQMPEDTQPAPANLVIDEEEDTLAAEAAGGITAQAPVSDISQDEAAGNVAEAAPEEAIPAVEAGSTENAAASDVETGAPEAETPDDMGNDDSVPPVNTSGTPGG